MSIRIMTQVWASAPCEGGELLVLLALADFANDEGWCHPSVATLAQKARLSDRQVRTHLRRLEERGLLFCPSTKGGAGIANHYRITLRDAPEQPSEKGGKAEADFRVEKAERRKFATQKAEVCDTKGGSPLPPNRKNRHEPSGYEREAQAPARFEGPPKVRIPKGWWPDPDAEAYAVQCGVPPANMEETVNEFRAYWSERSDKHSRKTPDGWRRTWRNHVERVGPSKRRALGGGVGAAFPGAGGQRASIASVVAWRKIQRAAGSQVPGRDEREHGGDEADLFPLGDVLSSAPGRNSR